MRRFLSKATRALIITSIFAVSNATGTNLTGSTENALDTPQNPTTSQWQTLKFEGSKLFISLSSELHRELLSSAQAREELLDTTPRPGLPPTDEQVIKLNLKTSVMGSHTDFTLWQNPDLRALQRTALYGGLKDWYRTYRFGPEAAYSLKVKPEKNEKGRPWQEWSKKQENFYDIAPAEQALSISETEAIFELIAQGRLSSSAAAQTLYVYDRDGILSVQLNVVGSEKIKVDYTRTSDSGNEHIEGSTNAFKVEIVARPFDTERQSADFNFMGYKDNIFIYIDGDRNLPLRIKGKADYVGEVQIDLSGVHY
ncbi:DUF3108 domain-containing protein [Oleiphilus messinensis]|uniref:hypothetical protein n=1 Tax=Oleiphilus messinensis TaxID=141451 RepID=UPI000B3B16B2|nr:hypothetical protein [Oleiphilus messinensis]